jgi:hypothetical protein
MAKFNLPEDHTIRNESPEGRTCVYIYLKRGGGINLIRTPFIDEQIVLFKQY